MTEAIVFGMMIAAALAQEPQDMAIDTGVPCGQGMPVLTVPSYDARSVPVDVVAGLVFSGGGCGMSSDWVLELRSPDGSAVYASEAWTWDGTDPVYVALHHAADLPADSPVVLTATHTEFAYPEVMEFPFRTDAGRVAGTTGEVQAAFAEAYWNDTSMRISLLVRVIGAADPDALSLLHIVGDTAHTYVRATSSEQFVELSLPHASEPDEVCVSVSQIDGHGVESAPVTVCGDVIIANGGCGCAGASGTSGTWAWPLSALALTWMSRSRRRHR